MTRVPSFFSKIASIKIENYVCYNFRLSGIKLTYVIFPEKNSKLKESETRYTLKIDDVTMS